MKTKENLHSQKKKKISGLTLSQVRKKGGIPGKNSEIEMEHKRKFLRKFVTPKWGKAGQGPQSKLTLKNDLNPLFSARGLEQDNRGQWESSLQTGPGNVVVIGRSRGGDWLRQKEEERSPPMGLDVPDIL